jgi:hypothetical protein
LSHHTNNKEEEMCDFENCPMLKRHADLIEENATEIKSLRRELAPAIEVWAALAGLAKILKWVGIMIKWVGSTVVAVIAIVKAWEYFS